MFGTIKIFLAEKTQKKMVIGSSSETKKVLLEYIDEENLPTFLGGKSDDNLYQDPF